MQYLCRYDLWRLFRLAIYLVMIKKRLAKISTLGSRLTSIISVTLVLLILGILAMTLEASHRLSDDIRSNIGFIVRLSPTASGDDINRVKQLISSTQGISGYVFSSSEDILAQESHLMGEDVGEMLQGENPFGAEFDVKVKSDYATVDSIAGLSRIVSADSSVEEIVTETAVVDSVNSVLHRLSIVLLAIAAALLIVSFVLINNTVSLAVYSRRFIIHTMKLVGATGGFIRRPFVLSGIAIGAIAAAVAILLLGGLRAYAATFDPVIETLLGWNDMILIFVAVAVAGILICALASTIATNRYLRADYDEMFK